MPPIDLDIDVLGRVFALVDVYTILSLSRVNRLFREITLTKQVWLSVVRDLAARQLIAAPSVDIDQLSKDALINEVKRAVAGPRTWSPESSLTPKLLRRLTFPLDSSQFVKLLPGNSYMLCHRLVSIPGFRDFRAIECFETKSGRLAWTWSRAGFNVLTVTFDFLAGTSEAVVALTVSIPTDESDHLIVLQVDLKTGHSQDLAHFGLPIFSAKNPLLCGDFFICCARSNPISGRWFIMLFNWRAENFVVLDNDMARLTQVPHPLVLLPGHLVLTSHGSGTPSSPTLQVHLYPITNFDDLWQPMSDFNFHDCIEVGQLSSIHLQVADQTPARYNVTLTCDESVLHHDTYELCVQIQNSVPPSPVTHFASLLKRLRIQSTAHNGSRSHMFTIYRCHVVLPPQRYSSSEPPKLVFKSKFCHSKQTRSMSRAGYGLELGYPDGDWGIYRLDKVGIRVPKTLLPDLDFAQYAKLTPLGAVFAREENRVVILEYQ